MPSATGEDPDPPLLRAEFDVATRWTYLDTAYASPLPRVAIEAMTDDARDAARGAPALDARVARLHEVRVAVAELLGVALVDVGLVPNTTRGLGIVSGGLDWRPGDRVVVRADEHSATVVPWRVQAHRGVEVTTVDAVSGNALVADVARELERGRVRVVALSWVHAYSGARTDLAALTEVAHAHGALVCVDAIQGAGVVPAAMGDWGVDLVALGAQKWTLGPHGIGAVAIRPELAERLSLPTAGDESLVEPWTRGGPRVARTARRFEAGATNLAGAAAWDASLRLVADAGVEAIWAWSDHLATRVAAGCDAAGIPVRSDRSTTARSAIVTVDVPGLDAAEAVVRLADHGVVVSTRAGGLRVSPAGWNTEAEVDTLLSALRCL